MHVSWCMTGAPIKQLLLDRRTTVSELKQMLEASAFNSPLLRVLSREYGNIL